MAHAKRLEILDLLAQRAWSVEELARELGLSPANVSQHLKVLRGARLVEVTRQGRQARYHLADASVLRLLEALHALAEARLPELDRLLFQHVGERPTWEGLEAAQAVKRAKEGEILLLDARPEEEYRAGHLPGALSVPVDRLEAFLDHLPKDRPVLVYCRGRYCTFADEAVRRLRALGYAAWRLEGGPWVWQLQGLWEGKEVAV